MKKFVAMLLSILFFIPIVGCDEPEPEPELLHSICLITEYVFDGNKQIAENQAKYQVTDEEPTLNITLPYDGYRRMFSYRVVNEKGSQIYRGWDGVVWVKVDIGWEDIGYYFKDKGYYRIVFGEVIHPSIAHEYKRYHAQMYVKVI